MCNTITKYSCSIDRLYALRKLRHSTLKTREKEQHINKLQKNIITSTIIQIKSNFPACFINVQ